MNRPRSHPRPSQLLARCGRAPARGAFTLIEALVAVGAMALVTVGIAAIFSTVGKTVAAGRRVSVLNSHAAMIEQQMRHDFAGMTRDGFLVLRNSWADGLADGLLDIRATGNTDWVALGPQDARARHRRVDEIMFFTNGDFASVREPLHPAYVATSKNARVYYGHGTRLPNNASFQRNRNPYGQPEIDDPNSAAVTGRLGEKDKANQYAGSWTLLRHVTLLVRPESTTPKLPPDTVFNWNPSPSTGPGARLLSDKEGQIALQPGASSIFRSLAYVLPDAAPGTLSRNYVRQVQGNRRPAFASGLVDIANNDLTDIRSIVMGMFNPTSGAPIPAYGSSHFNTAAQYPPTIAGFGVPPNPGWNFTPGPTALTNSHTWMENAWPTSSDPVLDQDFPPAAPADADRGTRIRYEPGPPEYINTITDLSKRPPEQAYRRADQVVLAASNFVVGCTEFIVEWSFGISDPASGTLVWHGLDRRADIDNNGTLDTTVARPYPTDPNGASKPFQLRYKKLDGTPGPTFTVDNTLLYSNPVTTPTTLSQTAYFGYLDPRESDGRPWAWPTLIRVTMNLTDPKNPGVEETFQFVFPTPGNPQ